MPAKKISSPHRPDSPFDGDNLKLCLDRIYARYNRREMIPPDPLQFVYRYTDPKDMEVAGFLAAALAYGRVRHIEKSVDRLLGLMGPRPAAFVRDFDALKRGMFVDFRHRFTSGEDICDLLMLLKKVLADCGGVEAYFARNLDFQHKNVVFALSGFCDSLLAEHARGSGGRVRGGVRYLLSSPTGKSACKRMNLFLRWMVRGDEVDAGLWKSVPAAKLLVPMDVHMSRICNGLGLCRARNISIKTVVEVTEGFGRLCKEDPVRYDFALCRFGMENGVGACEALGKVALQGGAGG